MSRDFRVHGTFGPVSGLVGRAASGTGRRPDLLVAIHGGTYTSRYFDVPGHSLIERANAAGFDVLALDRPGYGETERLEDGPAMLDRNASRISQFLPEVLSELDLSFDRIVLIGHSMGGVIASTIAAGQPGWPLAGIIGTGFAQTLPTHLAEGFAALPQQYYVELPTAMKDQLMFGPPETLAAGMPEASHVANTHMPRAEAIDIAGDWGMRAPDMLGRVSVPVYYKLAEFEQLWNVPDHEIVASMYGSSPRVETGIFTGAGHCIDFHGRGADFHDEILKFAMSL